MSRRGQPPSAANWTKEVDWMQADALDPTTYQDALGSVDGVVHTVGTLMENNHYKKVLRRDGTAGQKGVQAPATYGDTATYEDVNRDTAVRVSEAVSEAGVGMMLFISAAATPPGVDVGDPSLCDGILIVRGRYRISHLSLGTSGWV
jgi:uncharacterized protein YbjT (DUF2867 family)